MTVDESILRRNHDWARIIDNARRAAPAHMVTAEPRRPREQFGADWRAWVDRMLSLPGIFDTMEPMPNWLNEKPTFRLACSIKRFQRNYAYRSVSAWLTTVPQMVAPFNVTMTRYGPKVLDDDGCAASLKFYRDGVAAALGIDDGDTASLRFVPRQERAKWYGLRIHVEQGRTPLILPSGEMA